MNEHEQILMDILECRRIDLWANKPVLTPPQESRYQEITRRRQQGEPLQYILGSCEFMGLKFLVDERVLIPRPETEILVEVIIDKIKNNPRDQISILDLGTGSGNIPVALAKNINNVGIVSIDVSAPAIELAKQNVKYHSVEDKIEFINQDMKDFFSQKNIQKFDVIVSNPPYIESRQIDSLQKEVKREPRLALDGGADGLNFYRFIIENAVDFLKQGGFLAVEIGAGQDKALTNLVSRNVKYQNLEFIKDYSNINRIMMVECYG